MSEKNFMSYGDSETVFSGFAGEIKEKEPKIFKGTSAEWDDLTAAEQAQYSVKMITDDETGEVVDAVTNGDMRAVTSNAVATEVLSKVDTLLSTDFSENVMDNYLQSFKFYGVIDGSTEWANNALRSGGRASWVIVNNPDAGHQWPESSSNQCVAFQINRQLNIFADSYSDHLWMRTNYEAGASAAHGWHQIW